MTKRYSLGFILSLLLIHVTFGQNFKISGSNTHSVALCSDGSVFAWGLNNLGQLGLDPTSNGGAAPFNQYLILSSNTPIRVGGLGEIFQLDAGSGSHTLAMTCEGRVFAWGANGNGQLGNSTITSGNGAFSATPVLVERGVAPDINNDGFLGGVLYVSGGNDESLAILSDQRLVAWGQNDQGQLGDGTTIDRSSPVFVLSGVTQFGQTANQPLENVILAEAGDENGYAITADGRVWSWGSTDGSMPLGRPVANNTKAVPVQISDGSELTNIVQISAGDRHVLMIDDQGVVWSIGGDWGPGQRGLGTGYQASNYAEKVVGGASGETNLGDTDPILEVAAGQAHSMAVSASGRLYTWGANGLFNCGANCSTGAGQLGIGTTVANFPDVTGSTSASEAPQLALYGPGNPVDNAIGVSDGDAWTFVITEDNDVYVAGYNGEGQLGLNGASRGYFEELDLDSYGCQIPSPCPNIDLGEDFEVCPGFTHEIDAGLIFPGFVIKYYKDGVEQTASEFSVPFNTNGIPMTAPTLTITQTGTWKVEVIDNRDPNLGERGCNPCPTATDELVISFPTVNFADPGGLEFCGTTASVNVDESGASTTAINDYQWYTALSSGTLLGSTQDETSGTIDLTNVSFTGTIPNRVGTIYVEDVSTFNATIATPSEIGASAPSSFGVNSQNSRLTFDVESAFTLNSIDVEIYSFIANFSGTLVIKKVMDDSEVASSSITSVVQQNMSTTLTFDFDEPLETGNYYMELTSNGSGVIYYQNSGNALNTYNANGNDYLTFVSTNTPSSVQGSFPSYQNWDITVGQAYECGRIPVEIEENCPPCNKPVTVTTESNVSLCPGDDSNIAGTFVDGGNTPINTMYYVWYQAGTIPNVGDYSVLSGPIPNLTINNVNASTAGDWILRVQDGNDPNDDMCYTEDNVTISLNEIPTATLSDGSTICAEDLASNELNITISGGINPYSVSYTTDGILSSVVTTTGTTATILANSTGTYELRDITDANGCLGSITAETAIVDIHPDLTVTPDAVCDLFTGTATLSATISGGTPSYQLENEIPNGGTLNGGNYTNSFTANGITNYSYSIFDATGTSVATACMNNSSEVSGSIDCSCDVTGTLTLASSGKTTLCPGESTILEVTPSGSIDGAGAIYTVILTDGTTDYNATGISGGVHQFEVSLDSTYTIKSITDGNCTRTGSGSITITKDVCPGLQEASIISFSAFPNPTKEDGVNVTWDTDVTVSKIIVQNTSGVDVDVVNNPSNGQLVKLDDSKGIFLIEVITTDGSVYSQKVVKN